MEVERISTRPIHCIDSFPARVFAKIEISRFLVFLRDLYRFEFYFGGIWEDPGITPGPPRISLEAAGVSREHFGGIL